MDLWRVIITLPALTLLVAAASSSTNYQLNSYGLDGGSTNTSSSTNYKLNGSTGQISGDASSSVNGTTKSGSVQAQQANVPAAPTLSNGSGTYYNKLDFTINMSGDASDYTYVVAVSTDNFTTTSYVQADGTLGSTPVFQSYIAWGGASGSTMVGLSYGTTYKAKVSAKQGAFTQSIYGPTASIATATPSVSFSLTPNTISIGSLPAGTVVSAGTDISIGFSTNANSGGNVYIAGLNGALNSTATGGSIPSSTGSLSSLPQGFGAQDQSASQSSGGPFTEISPYDGSSSTVGAISTSLQPIFATVSPVISGVGTINLKAKSATLTPAASDYTEVLTFVAAASY